MRLSNEKMTVVRNVTAILLFVMILGAFASTAVAAPEAGGGASGAPIFAVNMTGAEQETQQVSMAIKLMVLMTLLSIAPMLVISLTSFTRIVIVFSFLRQALGVQQVPPNQVLIGLSLFLTYYIMSPVTDQMYTEAYQPYMTEQISGEVALEKAAAPLRHFMLRFTREKDLALFLKVSNQARPSTPADIPMSSLVPAFMLSELKTAFQIGFMIYVPFLVIDVIVSSVLLAMGMMVLPPMLIALPIKLMVFVLVDGWNLLVESLVRSFQV